MGYMPCRFSHTEGIKKAWLQSRGSQAFLMYYRLLVSDYFTITFFTMVLPSAVVALTMFRPLASLLARRPSIV